MSLPFCKVRQDECSLLHSFDVSEDHWPRRLWLQYREQNGLECQQTSAHVQIAFEAEFQNGPALNWNCWGCQR